MQALAFRSSLCGSYRIAARRGHLEEVKHLVECQGINVNATGDEGYTALHTACFKGQREVIKYLVTKGANVCDFALKNGLETFQSLFGRQLDEGECPVCFDSCCLVRLECEHQLCLQCLRSWFRSLKTVGLVPYRCPMNNCACEISYSCVLDYLESDEDRINYDLRLLEMALRKMADGFSCTSCGTMGHSQDLLKTLNEAAAQPFVEEEVQQYPDSPFLLEFAALCGYDEVVVPPLASVRRYPCLTAECNKCSNVWCVQCLGAPHPRMSCEEAAKDASPSEKESLLWKEQNARPCPQCRSPIQRDGGCSHMTCPCCKFEFCWWCLRKYTPGFYNYLGFCTCPTGTPAS